MRGHGASPCLDIEKPFTEYLLRLLEPLTENIRQLSERIEVLTREMHTRRVQDTAKKER